MLVLSRERDQVIMVGDDIEVVVVDIRGDKVRLGINAPKEIGVHRKEVYDAIRRENRAACQVKPEDILGLGKLPPRAGSADTTEAPARAEPVSSPGAAAVVPHLPKSDSSRRDPYAPGKGVVRR